MGPDHKYDMASVSDDIIAVHGRGGLLLPYSRFVEVDGVKTQVDISDHDIYVEIPSARIRKKLVIDPIDALSLRVLLTRTEVESIPPTPSPLIIIDETGEIPIVDWESKVQRVGYKGDPSEQA